MRASAIPGISLTFVSSALAYLRSAARSRPATCKSIGAGTPKFRTWLTISAGGKGEGVPGDWCGEVFPLGFLLFSGGALFGFWLFRRSAAWAPLGAGVFLGMLLAPAVGPPLFS